MEETTFICLCEYLAVLQYIVFNAGTGEADKANSGMIGTSIEERTSGGIAEGSSLWNGLGMPPAGITNTTLLLSERLMLLEARQRVEWHEQMDTPVTEAGRQRLHDRCGLRRSSEGFAVLSVRSPPIFFDFSSCIG